MNEPLFSFDRQHILDALNCLHGTENTLIEVRHKRGKGMVGHFSPDRDYLAKIAEFLNGKVNVYVTLNPIMPLLAELDDDSTETTKNSDIAFRRWAFLDFDPVRPADTASTSEQYELARLRAEDCAAALSEMGWPLPTGAYSGNGTHLLYPVDFDNNPETDQLFKALTEAIAHKWGDDVVGVDRSVHNAGRIIKLYGTQSVKGAEDDPERPRRYSQLMSSQPRILVTEAQMREVIESWGEVKRGPGRPRKTDYEAQATQTGKPFDMAGWLASHKIGVQSVEQEADHVKFVLDHCVFNSEHAAKDAAVFLYDNGTRGHRCLHASCSNNDWKALRAKFEPAYEKRQTIKNELSGLDLIVTDGKPLLQVNNCDQHDLTLNVLRIIADRNNPPTIFQRSGGLVILATNDAGVKLVQIGVEKGSGSITFGGIVFTPAWLLVIRLVVFVQK